MPDDPDVVLIRQGALTGAITAEEAAAREAAGTPIQRVTPGELAETHRQAVAEEIHGDLAGEVTAAIEGFGSGVTLGLSDVMLGYLLGDEYTEGARGRAEVNPLARGVGEVAGVVAPAVLTGGGSVAARAAQLTPAGRLAAFTARVANSAAGSGLARRAAAGGLAAAIDGAAAGAGNYLARQALAETPELSAEGFLRSAGLGALYGAPVGAAATLVGAGARRLATRLDDAGRAKLPPGPRRPRRPQRPDLVEAAFPAQRSLAGLGPEVADVVGTLAREIDDSVAAAAGRELDEALRLVPAADSVAIREQAAPALATLRETGEEAKGWLDDWIARGAPADDAAGPVRLAALEDARRAYDDAIGALPAAPGTAPTASAGAGAGILGDLAGDVVRSVPVIGPLVGAFLRGGQLARAAGKLGRLAADTPAARLADQVGATQGRLRVAAERAAVGALRGAARGIELGRPALARATRDALNQSPPNRANLLAGAARVGGPALAAQVDATLTRQRAYLEETRPRNPLQATPFASRWQPSGPEQRDWERRCAVLADPEAAIDAILGDGLVADIEAEALRALYPGIWTELREELSTHLAAIVQGLPEGQRVSLGLALELPLSLALVPPAIPPQASEAPPAVEMGRPSASTTSPLVDTEEAERGPGEPG